MANRIKTENDVTSIIYENLIDIRTHNKIGQILGRVHFSDNEKKTILKLKKVEKITEAIVNIVEDSTQLCIEDNTAKFKNEWIIGKKNENVILANETVEKKDDFTVEVKEEKKEEQQEKIVESTDKTLNVNVEKKDTTETESNGFEKLFGVESPKSLPEFEVGPSPEPIPTIDTDLKAYVEGLLVDVGDIRLSKFQVTQDLYTKVMGKNPSIFKDKPFGQEEQGNRPVENVTYEDAVNFCHKLNKLCDYTMSNGFRLPTEEEWQFAANGGQEKGKYKYPGSNNYMASAWSRSTSDGVTHEVGLNKQNVIINENDKNSVIYDLGGNVWEWCQPKDENSAVVNCYGGSYAESESSLELGTKDNMQSYSRKDKRNNIGFRICVNK